MASPQGVKVGDWNVGKSKGRNNNDVEGEGEGGSRFWMKVRFFVSCMALWSKAEDFSSGKSKQGSKSANDNGRDQPFASPTNSNSGTARSTPNLSEELKAYSHLRRFSFNQLKLATRNFKPENFLGEGGFGTVFKGWINPNGLSPARPGMGIPVAVKTLNQEGLQGHKEWLAEVNYLGELLHPNLVKLVGYCIEDEQRLLVYEFLPRGSLENHLFKRSVPLPWPIRMKIVLGAAKGLAFLHEEAERPVIFRDFKTSNILLDGDYNAKLSDFGLAKDAPDGDSSHVSTRVMGTYGYAAPEYVMTGHLTSKSDVYSFGVVLLEMLTGRRAMDKTRPPGQHNLVEWARPQLRNRASFHQLMDPRLQGQFSVRGAQRAIRLAAHCLCRDPKARPLMSEVVQVLKSLTDLNDMAHSSPSFQAMQAGPSNHGANKYGLIRTGSGSSSSRKIPSRFQASPCQQNYPLPPPKPSGGRP